MRQLPEPGSLDLWLLPAPPPGALPSGFDLSVLSTAELERAASFRRSTDRNLYVRSHAVLRRVLGECLDLDPRAVRISREPCPGCGGPHGRPAVAAGGRVGPHFSLSHSRGLALIALAGTDVGADVQGLRGQEAAEVCAASLHPGERAELAGAPRAELSSRFARLWTRKEAYLKGIGTGLSRSPSSDYLGDDPAARPPGWVFLEIPCGSDHAASVALRATEPPTTVRLRTAEPLSASRVPAYL